MSILDNIRNLCEQSNITLAALERKLEFSNGLISRWEKSSPTAEKLAKVADYFNVSADYLLGRAEKSNEFVFSGNELPDVLKPFAIIDTTVTMTVDEVDNNTTIEERQKIVEDGMKEINALEHKEDYSFYLSFLPKDMQNKPISAYDLFYTIGHNNDLMNAIKAKYFEETKKKTFRITVKEYPEKNLIVPESHEISKKINMLNETGKHVMLTVLDGLLTKADYRKNSMPGQISLFDFSDRDK